MLRKFLPQQNDFFELFRQAVDKLVLATKEFNELVHHPSSVNLHAKRIAEIEHEGDAIALLNYQLLHKTFITPIDRHDIHALTNKIDDVLDGINRLAQRLMVYQFITFSHEFKQLAELTQRVAEKVALVVKQLESLKNIPEITRLCMDIDHLENEAEAILLIGISKLFAEENDFKQFIKTKESFEQNKLIINSCQDIANLVKSIMLEYA